MGSRKNKTKQDDETKITSDIFWRSLQFVAAIRGCGLTANLELQIKLIQADMAVYCTPPFYAVSLKAKYKKKIMYNRSVWDIFGCNM